MMVRVVNWHLRKILHKSGLPDLPEVRRFLRLSFWDGFFFGALTGRVADARQQALEAMTQGSRDRVFREMVALSEELGLYEDRQE